MRVHLLYFAGLREVLGQSEELVSLADEVRTIRDLRRWLAARTPSLGRRLDTVRFAIDEAFEGDDTALHEGAIVALIPPVAGG
jgi:molybdopterin converting factor subunit 1